MRKYILYIMLYFITGLLSCSGIKKNSKETKMDQNYKYTNKLINENSPYLLQHAHNPVNWYPWGEEALEKAKKEDKLLIISIGYSACHWCHVMEHESFENEEIAKIMNDNFVCIKVDREEHPDVDQVYMTAVQILTGSGGWPLNCIALSDGRPVYGGTYFRPEQWKNILVNLAEQYKTNKVQFLNSAESIQKGIQQSEFSFSDDDSEKYVFEDINKAVKILTSKFDKREGGFNRAPKFPLPSFWHFLLEYASHSKDHKIKDQLLLTLNKMAYGGIYDQLGGGFARYSVDADWKVPHFEKMLYDNAQLVSLYSFAYQFSKQPLYKRIVKQTLQFIKSDMTSPEFAFYSSYDADSEGVEGKFYVWKKSEIETILGDDSELYCDYYNITNSGNWEHGNNILIIKDNIEKTAEKYKLTNDQLQEKIDKLSSKVFKEREKRIKPGLDDKVLTSWNALMISAYLDAYRVFDNENYLNQAESAAEFIIKHMIKDDHSLFRSYKKGNAKIDAFLDDYSFTIDAFIKLYQETGKIKYINIAKDLSTYVSEHFTDENTAMFYYSSDKDFNLIVRQKEVSDNVIPASNSSMAMNLYKLGMIYSDTKLIDRSLKMSENIKENAFKNIDYFGNWASLMLLFSRPSYELVITGENWKELKQQIMHEYRPDILYVGTKESHTVPIFTDRFKKGENLIYVCKNNVCDLPVKTVEEALKLLSE